jgi:hypothetical protein
MGKEMREWNVSGNFDVWSGKFDGWCEEFDVWCGKFDAWCGNLLLNCQSVRHRDVNTCLAETSNEGAVELHVFGQLSDNYRTAIRIAAGQPPDSLLDSLGTLL